VHRRMLGTRSVVTDWNPLLRDQLDQPYWADLQAFVAAERRRAPVYPPEPEVFAALHTTPHAEVKVVILGQDPYHGPGQAHGLCFSVRRGIAIPPSLVNVHTELRDDLGIEPPGHGDLTAWARQGVLLLNTTLTVRGGAAGSHQGKGWERFTDRVIDVVDAKAERVVFVLWGSAARSKRDRIDVGRHAVVESPHPSPLSAHRGFFGSRPFSATNQLLADAGREPVDWRLDP
jgi:uracil-DNA glycosylase